MNASRASRALEIASNAAYLIVVAAMLYMLFPGLRAMLGRFITAQLWNYHFGLYLERQRHLPGWQQEALEVRGRAKRKPAPPAAAV